MKDFYTVMSLWLTAHKDSKPGDFHRLYTKTIELAADSPLDAEATWKALNEYMDGAVATGTPWKKVLKSIETFDDVPPRFIRIKRPE